MKITTPDGWNEKALSDVLEGLNGLIQVKYEIENCVRGTYAVEGDKPEDLVKTLQEKIQGLTDAVDDLKAQTDQDSKDLVDNPIFKDIVAARGGNYVHAIEVESAAELEAIIQNALDMYHLHEHYSLRDTKQFIRTLAIYYIGPEDSTEEEAVYNYDVEDHLNAYL